MAELRDFYADLGIERTASGAEILSKYDQSDSKPGLLARAFRTKAYKEALEADKKASEAYVVLSNWTLKEIYDEHGSEAISFDQNGKPFYNGYLNLSDESLYSEHRDFYADLGIDKKATKTDIELAIDKLYASVDKISWDQYPEAVYKARQARFVLSNDTTKQAYDKYGSAAISFYNEFTPFYNGYTGKGETPENSPRPMDQKPQGSSPDSEQWPVDDRPHFDALFGAFTAPNTPPHVRDQAALALAQMLERNPGWKEEPAIHQALITHTKGFGLSSPHIKILHDTVMCDNETAEKHVFDQELKKFSTPNISAQTRNALASSLTQTLINRPELKFDPKVFTIIVTETEGSSALTMQQLLAATVNNNAESQLLLFAKQFPKFASPNAKLQTQQFYAPSLTQLITNHPELVTADVQKSISAALSQNPSDVALQELQAAVVKATTPRQPTTTAAPKSPKP